MPAAAPCLIFGPFALDLANACLWHGTEAVTLPPKAFDVLSYLVTHPDRLVTKDELLDAVWPQTAVTDAVVRVTISLLRKVLGDTVQTPQFIATVSRRGYRFLAPVIVVHPPETVSAEAPQQRAAPAPRSSEAVPPAPEVREPEVEAASWRCVICQQFQQPTARFCIACGAPRETTCSTCGQAVVLPATFCPACGNRLPVLHATGSPPHVSAALPTALAEKIRMSRTTLPGERKQVTVLFVDLKDSLVLIHDLDPEAAQQLLDPALHAMLDAVHRYEGTVNQVLGDGIMALFGAPIAHEDHAIRACYAALAMQAALRTYAEAVHRGHGLTLQSRVGLNSGEAVVRTIRNA